MTNTNRKQLHEKLWSAAVQLRANSGLKLNEISEPILGLIFLKFADVRFKRAQIEIEEERNKVIQGRHAPVTPDHYKSKGVLFLPEIATYSHLMSLPENKNIGKAVNDAMKEIEENNIDLAGVLPQDYTSLHKTPGENSKILISLLKNFNQIPDDIEGDAFGEIYEYFLGEFARSEGANGGEFFTPQSIVKLLVEIIEPYHGKIIDPACGSGGMFVQSANFVKAHSKKANIMNDIAIYGQEKGSSNIRTAKMNLAIHGLSGKIAEVNSFYKDEFNSVGKFDYVLANPPFNVKGKDKNKQIVIDPAKIKNDKRYSFGLPTTGKGEISNANYLWIQMFMNALNEKGRAGFVMHNSACDAGDVEKKIRIKLIESGGIDVIIVVGGNMFINVTLSTTLWFFDKSKKGTPREKEILFLNVSDIFTSIPGERVKKFWTDDQIQEIVGIVRSYRCEQGYKKYSDIRGRCRVVSIDEIKECDYSLNPRQYIDNSEIVLNKTSLEEKLMNLNSFLEKQTLINNQIDIEISNRLTQISKNIKWNNVEFSSSSMIEKMINIIYIDWFVHFKFPGNEKIKFIDSKSKFGDIPTGWEVKQVKNLLTQVKRKRKIKTDEYLDIGKFPIIDQGKAFIGGYTNEDSTVYNKEYILFGDHTRCFKYCNFPFACGADGTQLILSNDLLRMPQELFYVSLLNSGLQNNEYARHFKFLKTMKIIVPDSDTANSFKKIVVNMFDKIKQIQETEINLNKMEL